MTCKDCIHQYCCKYDRFFGVDEVENKCYYFKNKADYAEAKKIEIIRDDLKWWLETNNEKGVVYIPKFVVEKMIAKMDMTDTNVVSKIKERF